MISYSTKIVFCGDFCLASGSKGDLIYSRERNASPWHDLRSFFGNDVFVVANIEAPITHQTVGRPYKWANLRIDPDKPHYFDGLSLAILGNNHIGDFGVDAVEDTLCFFRQNNLSCVGVGKDLRSASSPNIHIQNGCKISFISLCCPTTNSEYLATHQAAGVAPISFATLANSIVNAKEQSDIVFIYFHWGCEWVHDPAPDQLRLARHAIDCGADAVLGCHSHTIQSYEQYKGKWIFYGLGNYCFDAGVAQAPQSDGSFKEIPLTLDPPNKESLVVSFRIKEVDKQPTLELDRVQPFKFGDDFLPVPCHQSQLSFDLSAANKRLRKFVNGNASFLDQRHEVEYKSLVRNGVMAYWYQKESISPPRKALKRKLLNRAMIFVGRIKHFVKRAASVCIGGFTA